MVIFGSGRSLNLHKFRTKEIMRPVRHVKSATGFGRVAKGPM